MQAAEAADTELLPDGLPDLPIFSDLQKARADVRGSFFAESRASADLG